MISQALKPKEINLDNLDTATAQEVFDHIAFHLLSQGQKSLASPSMGDFDCVYYSLEGLRCAAGSLITQQQYKPEFEGEDWITLSEYQQVPKSHRNLITLFQDAHDNTRVENWPLKLIDVAKQEGLLLPTFLIDFAKQQNLD
ncbi:MAG: hypothetical protein AAF984_09675 [Verrucomicrobiota bacterium]